MKSKIVPATEENILKSAEILKNDGVVVVPTETVYALVANAFSKSAVEKIFEIKKRPKSKPLSCNIESFKMQSASITSQRHTAAHGDMRFLAIARDRICPVSTPVHLAHTGNCHCPMKKLLSAR